ncbi:MAG: isopentenyl-diphosphate Delta-isomerase [Sarcina sp.]
MGKEYIAIVDKNDNILGYEEKMLVHEKGILHRAFSILLLNDNNEVLLQRRALEKYHSPGEWTNTCCSHQREGENIKEAAIRRLEEELGIILPDIYEKFVFNYDCKFSNELYENEIDHVFVGTYNGSINMFNKSEVCDTKWISYKDLKKWISRSPEDFTFWFKNIMEIIPENFNF